MVKMTRDAIYVAADSRVGFFASTDHSSQCKIEHSGDSIFITGSGRYLNEFFSCYLPLCQPGISASAALDVFMEKCIPVFENTLKIIKDTAPEHFKEFLNEPNSFIVCGKSQGQLFVYNVRYIVSEDGTVMPERNELKLNSLHDVAGTSSGWTIEADASFENHFKKMGGNIGQALFLSELDQILASKAVVGPPVSILLIPKRGEYKWLLSGKCYLKDL